MALSRSTSGCLRFQQRKHIRWWPRRHPQSRHHTWRRPSSYRRWHRSIADFELGPRPGRRGAALGCVGGGAARRRGACGGGRRAALHCRRLCRLCRLCRLWRICRLCRLCKTVRQVSLAHIGGQKLIKCPLQTNFKHTQRQNVPHKKSSRHARMIPSLESSRDAKLLHQLYSGFIHTASPANSRGSIEETVRTSAEKIARRETGVPESESCDAANGCS